MQVLTRAEFLGLKETEFQDVPLGGGRAVRVRTLSEKERSEHELSVLDKEGNWSRKLASEQRVRLLARCLVNQDGSRMFGDNEYFLLREVLGKYAGLVYTAARKLNGFSDSDVEELEKNSDTAPAGDSPSDSPCAGASSTSTPG